MQVGDELPQLTVRLTREDLRAYADASGDHNPIHLDDGVAAAVGLPGVIAHGMLTMGHAARVVTEALGQTALRTLSVRFTRPVVVPALDDEPAFAEVTFGGTVTAIDEQARVVTIALSAVFAGQTVLARAQATAQLP